MACKIIKSCVAKVDEFINDDDEVQIELDGDKYAVGDLCQKALLKWDRPLNARPDTKIWQVLLMSALHSHAKKVLNGSYKHPVHVDVVAGAPKHLVKIFRVLYPESLKGKVQLRTPKQVYNLQIDNIAFLPECGAHAIAISSVAKQNCLVISCGFATVELGAATGQGVVYPESLDSLNYGLHMASEPWRHKLIEIGYDNPHIRNDQFHYWDTLLQNVIDKRSDLRLSSIFSNVHFGWKELYDPAEEILTDYTNNLIEQINSYFNKFNLKIPVIIAGGGINHPPIRSGLKKAIEKMGYKVFFPPKEIAQASAAIGYQKIAQRKFGKNGVGVDVGNHSVAIKV